MDKIIELFHLDLRTIAIALIDVVLLVFIVYFLVVKHIKKIMAERKAKNEEIYKENERLNGEVTASRVKYDTLTKEATEKIAVMTKDATRAAEDKAQKIVDEAKKEAAGVIAAAKQEMEAERLRMEQYFKTHVTSLAVDLAVKVLEREVTEQDNSKILDDCLSKWSN